MLMAIKSKATIIHVILVCEIIFFMNIYFTTLFICTLSIQSKRKSIITKIAANMPKRKSSSTTTAVSKRSTAGTSTTQRRAVGISRAIEKASRDHETLSKNVEKYILAYQASNEYVTKVFEETLRQADQDIEDRETRLAELQDSIDYQVRQGKIQVQQNLEEFGMQEARKLLSQNDMVPILESELDGLRQQIASLSSDHEQELAKAVRDAIIKEKMINASVQAKIKSDCALQLAETKAQLASKDIIVESLRDRIEKGAQDLEAQRELTRSVAESASQSATNVYTTASK